MIHQGCATHSVKVQCNAVSPLPQAQVAAVIEDEEGQFVHQLTPEVDFLIAADVISEKFRVRQQ